MKVFEFAKKIGIQPMALMDKVKSWKLPVKSHMVELSPELMDTISKKLDKEKEEVILSKTKKKTSSKKSRKKSKKVAKATRGAKTSKTTSTLKKKKTTVVSKATKPTKPTKIVRAIKKATPSRKSQSTDATTSMATMGKVVTVTSSSQRKSLSPTIEGPITKGKEGIATRPSEKKKKSKSIIRRRAQEPKAQESPSPSPEAVARQEDTMTSISAEKVLSFEGEKDVSRREGSLSETSVKTTSSQEKLKGNVEGPAGLKPSTESKLPRRFEERSVDKKTKTLDKEQELKTFSATDLRKREMVFVPRKKKVTTTGEMKKTQITTPKAIKRVIKVHGRMQANEFAQKMGVKWKHLRQTLSQSGIEAKPLTPLDFDTITLMAPEFGFEAKNVSQTYESFLEASIFGELKAEPQVRPPVVTVMGHVDHGKTSLLDAIRSTNVTAKESGGITQHIGAYSVEVQKGRWVTFIDTPGHAAFTAMRARGASVTDIVILVVAADDGLMPQTLEAIHHAQAAKVPILVAINKMDLEGANVEKIQKQLAEQNLLSEEWGGETLFCKVSAVKKEGIQDLLEKISLLAEMLEIKANAKRSASGVVIESRLEKGRGPVASLLVQEGTLQKGAFLTVGTVKGKARGLVNDQGKGITEIGPGFVVEALGLEGIPEVGSAFHVFKDEKKCQRALDLWSQRPSASAMEERNEASQKPIPQGEAMSPVSATSHVTHPNSTSNSSASTSANANSSSNSNATKSEEETENALFERLFKRSEDQAKKIHLVLKVDVMGSGEAVKGMLNKLSTKEVEIHFVHTGVGAISETDVLLASTTGAYVIGFNVRPYSLASEVAKREKVAIKTYSIIYELVDDMKSLMEGFLAPKILEKVQGKAEIRNLFSVPKMGTIGGCSVIEGKINRSSLLRLLRDGRIIYEGKVGSLRRFKDDVKEVAESYECGIGIENFNDLKVGDIIEAYQKEEVKRTL